MPQQMTDQAINGTAPPKTELEQLQFQANQVTDEVFIYYLFSLLTYLTNYWAVLLTSLLFIIYIFNYFLYVIYFKTFIKLSFVSNQY